MWKLVGRPVLVQAVVSVQEVTQIPKWRDLRVGLKRGGAV